MIVNSSKHPLCRLFKKLRNGFSHSYGALAMKRGSLEAKIVVQKGQRFALVNVSGSIGLPFGFQGNHFIESLTNLGKYDVLYAIMDSPGGSPVEAWIIFHFLTEARQTRSASLVLIIGECSGDAVLIALAFDQIFMRHDAHMEFRPAGLSRLPATRQVSDLIARRAGCQAEDVLAWMDRNRRFTAEECLIRSLCDAII